MTALLQSNDLAIKNSATTSHVRIQLAVSAYLPARKWLASSQLDSNLYGISVLNIATLDEVIRLPASNGVKAMSVSSDGQWFAACQNDGEVRVWRTETPRH